MRHTTALLAAVLLFGGAVGCSSSDGTPTKTVTKTATATATATPPAAPVVSRDETIRLCTDAVAEAAPGWENWSYNPGWADDPRTPTECLPLKDEEVPSRGNLAFMDALIAGLNSADDPRARS
jgi:hypothetical protein